MCMCVYVCIGLNDIWVGKAFKHLWLCLLKHLNTVWVMVDQGFPYTYRLLHNLDKVEKKNAYCADSHYIYSNYLLQPRVAYILIPSIFLHLESCQHTQYYWLLFQIWVLIELSQFKHYLHFPILTGVYENY